MTKEITKKWKQFIPVTIGIIYGWLGFQKFIPGLSIYEELVNQSMEPLSQGIAPAYLFILMLGILECSIGIMLIFFDRPKYTLVVAFVHISCTFLSLLLVNGLNTEVTLISWFRNLLIVAGLVVIYPYKKQVQGAHTQPYPATGMRLS
jgi:uncharacterized membrane protein YphA (DoxX/SURF4 family)